MPIIETARLLLLPLSQSMMQTRLAVTPFDLTCLVPRGQSKVHFPETWPGDALAMYPGELKRMGPQETEVAGSFAVVDAANHVAVGQLGAIGRLGDEGTQEIGYGINPEACGQGFATEAVGALAAHLLTWPPVNALTAETAVSNRASERVLEKVGFARTGTSWNQDDGDLVTWRLNPAVVEHS
jgi:RimJ/RimL family protein N-acetyltransferase